MINPTRGKIFAQILSEETITKSGIILARTIKEIPRRARVLAVGAPELDKKGRIIKPVAKVGNIVHFKKGFGVKYSVEGENGKWKHYIFLKNEEITARETNKSI